MDMVNDTTTFARSSDCTSLQLGRFEGLRPALIEQRSWRRVRTILTSARLIWRSQISSVTTFMTDRGVSR